MQRSTESASGVYGAREFHAELNRGGHRVARCAVERLMREEGVCGIRRRKPASTVNRNGSLQRLGQLASMVATSWFARVSSRLCRSASDGARSGANKSRKTADSPMVSRRTPRPGPELRELRDDFDSGRCGDPARAINQICPVHTLTPAMTRSPYGIPTPEP